MSAAPRKEVTTREVVAVRFGMLTDDEVGCWVAWVACAAWVDGTLLLGG